MQDLASVDERRDPRSLAARLLALAARAVVPGAWLRQFIVGSEPVLVRAAVVLARFSRDPATFELLGPLARAVEPELRRTTLETALFQSLPGAWESAAY